MRLGIESCYVPELGLFCFSVGWLVGFPFSSLDWFSIGICMSAFSYWVLEK